MAISAEHMSKSAALHRKNNVYISVNNSWVGRITPNKQTNKQTNKQKHYISIDNVGL